jgi:DNA repair protein RecO (recombination protein O)
MDERTTGIILRTRPLTETSLIVHWLTADAGRIATVAKGARRAKSPFAGRLDIFFDAALSFQRQRHGDLHSLREVGVLRVRDPIRRNFAALEQASYFVRLIEQTTEVETPLPAIFDLMTAALDALPAAGSNPVTVFAFEVKLLSELGLSPIAAPGRLSAGAREILGGIPPADWSLLGRIRLSEAQVRELQHFLHAFLVENLGKVPALRATLFAG